MGHRASQSRAAADHGGRDPLAGKQHDPVLRRRSQDARPGRGGRLLTVLCATPYIQRRSYPPSFASSTSRIDALRRRTGMFPSIRIGDATIMISALSEDPLRPCARSGGVPIATEVQACGPACPRCKTGLTRIRRRFVDRVISAIRPVRRYRCQAFFCCWEGALPHTGPVADRPRAAKTGSPTAAPAGTIAPGGHSQLRHFDTAAPT